LDDYYEVLGVRPSSSTHEIEDSFREKSRALNPENGGADESTDAKLSLLLRAYETLSDPEKRRDYDQSIHSGEPLRDTDYRHYLQHKQYDLESQSKLVFYDLINNHHDEAVDIYEHFFCENLFYLEHYLSRDDFMDCLFLLGEVYEARGEYNRAYQLFKSIVTYEYKHPYFRHFLAEVVEHLRTITCFKMPTYLSWEENLRFLQEMVGFNFSNKDKAFFYKKISEIYSNIDDNETASYYLRKGLSLDRNLAGVKKLKEKIGFAENPSRR
jgi:curved DNA-binding protein CbpA